MDTDINLMKFEIDRLKHAYLDLKEEMNLLISDQKTASMTRKRGALATAGVTCESLLKFVYKNEGLENGGRPASTMMLEDLIQKLNVVFPAHVLINIRTIQAWRNMGAHDKGDFREIDDFTISQVEQSLNSIVLWFFNTYLDNNLIQTESINLTTQNEKIISNNSKENTLEFLKNKNVDYFKIGNQIWMLNNLNVTQFQNGDLIAEAKTKKEWNDASKKKIPVFCHYKNSLEFSEKHGKLYNWYALNDPRGLAPMGWVLPTKLDFDNLILIINNDVQSFSKFSNFWKKDDEDFGRRCFGDFEGNKIGDTFVYSRLWSSTENRPYQEAYAFIFGEDFQGEIFYEITESPKNHGFSVRCILCEG